MVDQDKLRKNDILKIVDYKLDVGNPRFERTINFPGSGFAAEGDYVKVVGIAGNNNIEVLNVKGESCLVGIDYLAMTNLKDIPSPLRAGLLSRMAQVYTLENHSEKELDATLLNDIADVIFTNYSLTSK